MEDCSTGQSAVVWVRKPNFRSFCCSQLFVCQVWLSRGPPEMFTFSNCIWLWNCLITARRFSPGLLYKSSTVLPKATSVSWICTFCSSNNMLQDHDLDNVLIFRCPLDCSFYGWIFARMRRADCLPTRLLKECIQVSLSLLCGINSMLFNIYLVIHLYR